MDGTPPTKLLIFCLPSDAACKLQKDFRSDRFTAAVAKLCIKNVATQHRRTYANSRSLERCLIYFSGGDRTCSEWLRKLKQGSATRMERPRAALLRPARHRPPRRSHWDSSASILIPQSNHHNQRDCSQCQAAVLRRQSGVILRGLHLRVLLAPICTELCMSQQYCLTLSCEPTFCCRQHLYL